MATCSKYTEASSSKPKERSKKSWYLPSRRLTDSEILELASKEITGSWTEIYATEGNPELDISAYVEIENSQPESPLVIYSSIDSESAGVWGPETSPTSD